jgi:condensin complex subunit 3
MESHTVLTDEIEEEKKTLAPLLGKLHISPASTETKICELYSEVNIAVDDKLVSDATGRNALLKIHVSLGKIVNNSDEKANGRKSMAAGRERDSTTPEESVVEEAEDDTPRPQANIEEEDEEDDVTVLEQQLRREMTAESSIAPEHDEEVDELLEDTKMELDEDEIAELSTMLEESTMVLPQRPRRQQAAAPPAASRRPVRSSRARDSLVDELLSDDEDEL